MAISWHYKIIAEINIQAIKTPAIGLTVPVFVQTIPACIRLLPVGNQDDIPKPLNTLFYQGNTVHQLLCHPLPKTFLPLHQHY